MKKITTLLFIIYYLLQPTMSLAVEESSFFQFPDGATIEMSFTKNNYNDPFCVCLQKIVNPNNNQVSYEIVLNNTWSISNQELTESSQVISDSSQCQQEAKKEPQTACNLIRYGGGEIKPKTTEVKTTKILDEFKLQAPTLTVRIPGFENFSLPPTTMDESGRAYFPWIGEYIRAIYNFGLIAISILAVLMIIVSGIRVIMSGFGGEKKEAYKRISQAVIGLCLAWGSYTILYIINPELLNLRSLGVKLIKPIPLEYVKPADYSAITGQAVLPKGEIANKAITAAKKIDLDPCYMITILSKESGGRPDAIGHDENYTGPALVKSRKIFLLSGIKKSGAVFAIPATADSYQPSVHNKTSVTNDDTFTNTPPDYGLDWRFSHGIGLGQITIFPTEQCGGERGKSFAGKCYSIPSLLKVEENLDYTARLFKDGLSCADKKGLTGDDKTLGAFYAYNAGCGNLNKSSIDFVRNFKYAQDGLKIFNQCKANKQPSIGEVSTDETIFTPRQEESTE